MPGLKPINYRKIVKFDYSGPSHVDWNHGVWKKSRAAFYAVQIELDNPPDIELTMPIRVMQYNSVLANRHIGTCYATFSPGQKVGKVFTNNNAEAQGNGFPATTKDKFWLVVTKRGNLRGNLHPADSGDESIFLQAAGVEKKVGAVKHGIHGVDGRGRPRVSPRYRIRRREV